MREEPIAGQRCRHRRAEAIVETPSLLFRRPNGSTPRNYDRDPPAAAGAPIAGPAIIVQYDTTTVLLPGHWAETDELGNFLHLAQQQKRVA